MFTSLSIKLKPETLRSVAFGSISSSYTALGSALSNPARIFMLQNFTDTTLFFSFDGVNDHLVIPSDGFLLLDATANKTREQGFYVSEGTQIYVKDNGSAASSGSAYLSVFYGSTN